MLIATIVIWALNFTVTRYVLQHGFHPLAYSTVRYGIAATLFASFTYAYEGSFRVRRRDFLLLVVAAGSGGVSGDVKGDLLGVATAATWAAYSVAIAPLMRRYSPYRISAIVLVVGWLRSPSREPTNWPSRTSTSADRSGRYSSTRCSVPSS